MKRALTILLMFTIILSANVRVSNVEVLNLGDNLMDPVFSDDGNFLLYTSLDGGNYLNLNTKKSTNFAIAAYDYSMDKSGNIRYRIDTFIDKRKVNSVKIYNSNSKQTEILIDKQRLDIIPSIKDHGIYYVQNEAVNALHKKASSVSRPVVMSYNNSLLLYSYGTSKIMTPSGDMYYLWPSVSPNDAMIAYTDMKDLVVTDFNSDILFTIKEARSPKWSPDGKYIVFMRDLDDGHTFTSSDLFVVRVADQEVFQLTETDNRMEMYPSWSPDGKKIVCEDAQNDEILILTLEK
ncbi:MAG: hypothetical protein WCT23_04850 [Candidatus Neomarinimicrobiota bacterium]